MPTVTFKKQFVQKIKDDIKRAAIRKIKLCKLGEDMQLCTGHESRLRQKIASAKCVGIAKVIISDEKIWEISDPQGWSIRDDSKITFHECQGFDNAKQMLEFFRKEYGLPFKGYVHFWALNSTKKKALELI